MRLHRCVHAAGGHHPDEAACSPAQPPLSLEHLHRRCPTMGPTAFCYGLLRCPQGAFNMGSGNMSYQVGTAWARFPMILLASLVVSFTVSRTTDTDTVLPYRSRCTPWWPRRCTAPTWRASSRRRLSRWVPIYVQDRLCYPRM